MKFAVKWCIVEKRTDFNFFTILVVQHKSSLFVCCPKQQVSLHVSSQSIFVTLIMVKYQTQQKSVSKSIVERFIHLFRRR